MNTPEETWHFNHARAEAFARIAHGVQVRKYTGEPYVNHCVSVAKIIQRFTNMFIVIDAALLHDVLEDTSVTADEMHMFFGRATTDLVLEVTDVSKPTDGNRAYRKALDRDHLAKASPFGKLIKLADLIDNTESIIRHDPGFAKIYLAEKHALLPFLSGSNDILYNLAWDTLIAAEKQLQARSAADKGDE